MSEKKALLVLRLEGVLQAWGENSKWDYRDSASMPTRSGIVGLLACALGYERGNPGIAQLASNLTIAVRADRQGTKFADFQTVQGEPLMAANGKPRGGGNTIISRREYLQDASFTVFIECGDSLCEALTAALENPKWCLYLGRKNCVPSRPVLECAFTEYDSLEDCVVHYPPADRAQYPMSVEWEQTKNGLSSRSRSDGVGEGERNYTLRTVWQGVVKGAES